jgi:ABC-type transport system involved in cytochrome c biogenesis permease subunit
MPLNKDYKNADDLVESINGFQKRFGSKVRPSDDKSRPKYCITNLIYCKATLLVSFASILMLLYHYTNFKETKLMRVLVNTMHIVIAALFVLHTFTLGARWFISGHAPWSNAYEAIVYVAWATMFFGLAFDIKSKLTVVAARYIILSAAYMN